MWAGLANQAAFLQGKYCSMEKKTLGAKNQWLSPIKKFYFLL
jgi:hypothetical protein